jgi:predicted TIM-barrel fold metal-dependent hydrolase
VTAVAPGASPVPTKIWANSGDSHVVEPRDLFTTALPAALAARMPRSEWDADGRWETITIDGRAYRRRLVGGRSTDEFRRAVGERAPGANDPHRRLADLDEEGVWAEVIYPSLGIWTASITDPVLLRAGCEVINDWFAEFQQVSPRYVCTASIPLLDVGDAVAEVERAAGLGFRAIFLPVGPPTSGDDWQSPSWDPVWAAVEDAGLVVGYHIGTEPLEASEQIGIYFRGPGGALLNYMETTYGGQRAVSKMIAGGVFDRFPRLRVLVSEGGATWGPFVADRLDEAYRQHRMAVRPELQRMPSEYLHEHVYASFQHDRSAVFAMTAMGWRNVMWGSDYPHLEGTYGHTQETLHELFDDVPAEARERITIGAFAELFPHVPPIPASVLAS